MSSSIHEPFGWIDEWYVDVVRIQADVTTDSSRDRRHR